MNLLRYVSIFRIENGVSDLNARPFLVLDLVRFKQVCAARFTACCRCMTAAGSVAFSLPGTPSSLPRRCCCAQTLP